MKELHTSERTYSLAMFTLVKVYMPLLKGVLSASEFKTMFCNADEVLSIVFYVGFSLHFSVAAV